MIHHVASANILPSKAKQAEQFLLQVAAFVNQKFPGAHSHILRNFDGKGNRIHILETWDSVSAWEVASGQIEADPNWSALMHDLGELFDFDSFERHFYQIIAES